MSDLPAIRESDITPLIQRAVMQVRPDMRDNPYIEEAIRVLPVGGYRSAIGAFWNAVIDDLRNKIIFRSIKLFNKEINVGRAIENYEDLAQYINDDQLIEGAYKIGVIGWEAYKLLKHSKESRHIFSGHPKSSDPSLIKVLSVIDDCIKYVLNEEYPAKIIDIDEYIESLKSDTYDRNTVSIENALGDLPDNYKSELTNRLFSIYVHPDSSSILLSNIEYLIPLLWKFITRETKIQVIRRVDQEIPKGNTITTDRAFSFVNHVKAAQYLSTTSKKYIQKPIIDALKENLDNWREENELVKNISVYAEYIVDELIDDYVWAITHTFVGYVGHSAQFNRTDFYANAAAIYIPDMFQVFNDRMAQSFINTVKTSDLLKQRIRTPSKLRRLRSLAQIVLERISDAFQEKIFLEVLIDENRTEELFRSIS